MQQRYIKLKVFLFLFGFISIYSTQTQAQSVLHGPYVQNISKNTAVIKWKTFFPSRSFTHYGTTESMDQFYASKEAVYDHEVELTHLEPNKKYYYRIAYYNLFLSFRYTFHTAPTDNESNFSFAVVGDTGAFSLDQFAIADILERCSFNFLLHTGDIVYPDGDEGAYDFKFFEPYKNILYKIPFFTTIGNHDAKTNMGAPYLKIFSLPHNNIENSELYYSFEWGNALFISLDSIVSPFNEESAQYKWLVQTLEESQHKWKFIFFHVPIFTSSKRHNEEMQKAWAPLFEKYKVDIVFSGHDHYYERFHPIQGVTYIVSGGGGAKIREDREYERHPASLKLFKKHHFLVIDMKPQVLHLRAIDIHNRIIDEFDIQKAQ